MPTTKRERAADLQESKETGNATSAPPSSIAVAEAVVHSSKSPSPFDVYFEALEKCVKEQGALGYIVLRGISDDDDDDDSEDEDSSDRADKYSQEQMNLMRVVLVTQSRENSMKKADSFATCKQSGSPFMMFNTHSGNVIICGIPKEIAKVSKLKTAAERFDGLFALTRSLNNYDYWFAAILFSFAACELLSHSCRMHDNEEWDEGGGLDQGVKLLAKAWNTLLVKHTNAEMKVDAEYTRPGVELLLANFASKLKECPSRPDFNWKPKS